MPFCAQQFSESFQVLGKFSFITEFFLLLQDFPVSGGDSARVRKNVCPAKKVMSMKKRVLSKILDGSASSWQVADRATRLRGSGSEVACQDGGKLLGRWGGMSF